MYKLQFSSVLCLLSREFCLEILISSERKLDNWHLIRRMLCCVQWIAIYKEMKTKLCNNSWSVARYQSGAQNILFFYLEKSFHVEHKMIPPSPQNSLSKSVSAFLLCSDEGEVHGPLSSLLNSAMRGSPLPCLLCWFVLSLLHNLAKFPHQHAT